MQPGDLNGPKPTFATIDVSFISLKLSLPALGTLLEPGSGVVALIKPQFEAGRDKVGKSGVVREPGVHKEVLRTVLSFAAEQGFILQNATFSPITGGEGNIEFLAYWLWQPESERLMPETARIEALVREAGQTCARDQSEKV
jgi:23S rRNA (cytidine1920-2'-O)/16S rRNA (cytidine1409-2'-O)-methyltransferase